MRWKQDSAADETTCLQHSKQHKHKCAGKPAGTSTQMTPTSQLATCPSATTQHIPVLQVRSHPPACRQLLLQAQAQTAQTALLLWACQVLQHHLLHLLLML
jgi:hypothetical protein